MYQVGNPEDRFSRDEAQLVPCYRAFSRGVLLGVLKLCPVQCDPVLFAGPFNMRVMPYLSLSLRVKDRI